MPLLVALILALFALPALADDSCVPYLECKPLTTKAVHGPLATHLFWFVRNDMGGIDHHGFSCEKSKCDVQKLMAVGNEVINGSKAPAAAWTEHMSFNCDYGFWDTRAGENPICAERKLALLTQRDAWLEGIPRQLPWKVKPLAGSTTRPVYRVINGVVSSTPFSRVSVGEVCDLTKPTFASGVDRFMHVISLGSLPVVALCGLASQ